MLVIVYYSFEYWNLFFVMEIIFDKFAIQYQININLEFFGTHK